MAQKLNFRKVKNVGFLAAMMAGSIFVSRNVTPPKPLEKEGYNIQIKQTMSLDAIAAKWAKMSIAKAKTDFFSNKESNYYGPYALNLKQLIAAGYVENNGNRYDWTDKEVDGTVVDSREAFLQLSKSQHLAVFKEMLLGMQESFKYFERNDGLLTYALLSGDEKEFFRLYGDSFEAAATKLGNFGDVSLDALQQAMPEGDLIHDIGMYDLNQRTALRYAMDADEFQEVFEQQQERVEQEMEAALPAVPEGNIEPIEEETVAVVEPESQKKLGFAVKVESERKASHMQLAAPIAMKTANHFWNRRGEPQKGVFKDAQGTKRYTAAGLSLNDLKLAGFLVKNKSGALIWSEKAGIHNDLGISYKDYQENWKEHADAARQKFVEWADANMSDVMDSFMPAIWNNVVQAYGGDNYLDAEGYQVGGKEYTLDAISITALARFHGMKATMKFLESRDRANPVISESMKETLEIFHGSEHPYDMKVAPWRVFEGAGGVEYRTLDYRKQYAVPDMGKDDYMLLLESKAFRESSYNLTARSGSYKGFYQIHKNYLSQELAEYNKANSTEYTTSDFDKKQWLQTAIIKQFHQKTAGYAKSVGLVDYTPYIMNRNIVEFEYLSPKYDIQKSMILTPEKFAKAKLLQAGQGDKEFGYQVGAIYSLNGNKVRVTEVGTRSIQIDPNMLLSMAHLGGSGNISKSMERQVRWNQQAFEDGNKTPVFEYAFLTNHAINSRTIKDAKSNDKWDVPSNKSAFSPEKVYKKLMPEFKKQQAVKGRQLFDAQNYQKANEKQQSPYNAFIDSDAPDAKQGNWHHRVGQMSNKERRQHGIS